MVTPLLVVLLSSSPLLEAYTLPPSKPAKCSDVCAKRYRLTTVDDDDGPSKARAIADDGTKCNVVGARRCLSKRRLMWDSNGGGALTRIASTLGLR